MNTYFVGAVGVEIIVDCEQDISTATVMKMLVRKPSGEEVEWDASFGPPNAQGEYTSITYTVETGDWDEAGYWTLYSYVEMPGYKSPGAKVQFKLDPAP